MVFIASALEAAEAEFCRLVPDPLFLEATDLAPLPGLPDKGLDLLAVRDLVLAAGTSREVKDAVWRVVIARARMSQAWMVGAMGLAMPALRAVARRCSRGLTAEQVADVDAEIAAGFIAALREINTDYAGLAWYLRCRAQRAGLRARRAVCERPAPVDACEEPDSPQTDAEVGAPSSPDALLQAAVGAGVISGEEAELIGATRLEATSLRDFAEQRGTAYWALAKRRSRAEDRLVAALRAGSLSAAVPEDPGVVARVFAPRVSKSAWALAL